jgi:hypothetical protein
MGVTIHYRGKLDDIARLEDLRNELKDIATWMGWETRILDDDQSEPPDVKLVHNCDGAEIQRNLALKGIVLHPESQVDSIEFLFDREGNLRSIMNTIMICEGTFKPEDTWNFVKTQFGGPDVHVWIIGLLKHVKKHYISNLEVHDEGEYWETGSRKTLEDKMHFINSKIDLLSRAFSTERFGDISSLSADQIAELIERILKDKDD